MDATKRCPFCAEEIQAAAIKCKHCGSDLTSVADTTAAETTELQSELNKYSRRRIVIGIIAGMCAILWFFHEQRRPESSGVPPSAAPTDVVPTVQDATVQNVPPVPPIQLPADEVGLIKLVESARARSAGAANDLERGGIKHDREMGICSLLTSGQVRGWIGTVAKLDSDRDGKGDLSVKIAEGATLRTWNNRFSDIMDDTRLDPGTPLFARASELRVGQTIQFSGHFFRTNSEGDCIREASLTLNGQLTEPEFVFRFESMAEPDATTTAAMTASSPTPPSTGPANASALTDLPEGTPTDDRSVPVQSAVDQESGTSIYAIFVCYNLVAGRPPHCVLGQGVTDIAGIRMPGNAYASLEECRRAALYGLPPQSKWVGDRLLTPGVSSWLECYHRHVDTWEN